jgi:hypothetical protein
MPQLIFVENSNFTCKAFGQQWSSFESYGVADLSRRLNSFQLKGKRFQIALVCNNFAI